MVPESSPNAWQPGSADAHAGNGPIAERAGGAPSGMAAPWGGKIPFHSPHLVCQIAFASRHMRRPADVHKMHGKLSAASLLGGA